MSRPWSRIAACVAGLVLLLPATYALAALVLGLLPGPERPPAGPTRPVYLVSNGWHVWLALPYRDAAADWTALAPDSAFAGDLADRDYIAFGWGDRAFYLHTRRPGDLRAGLAIGALLGTGPAVLHAMRLAEPTEGIRADGREIVRRIDADEMHLAALAAHVRRHFTTPDGNRPIPGAAYGPYDAFFPAEGRYSPWRTCNEWVAEGLRAAGLRVGLWSPFAFGVMGHP